jgi:hypothetical protein
MGDENVSCYTGACPECGEVLAVTVADVQNTALMRHALRDQAQWKRSGLVMSTCTVSDVRSGRVKLDHKSGCSRDKRARRTVKQARLGL